MFPPYALKSFLIQLLSQEITRQWDPLFEGSFDNTSFESSFITMTVGRVFQYWNPSVVVFIVEPNSTTFRESFPGIANDDDYNILILA